MKSFFIPQEPGGDYATLQIKTKIANDFFKDEIKGGVKDDFFETLHPRIMMETFIYLWENNKLEGPLCLLVLCNVLQSIYRTALYVPSSASRALLGYTL